MEKHTFKTAEFAALPPVQMQPMLLWKDGAPTDFTYRDIRQYGGYLRAEPCESFSALLDRFYTETDHAERMRQRSQTLRIFFKLSPQKCLKLACVYDFFLLNRQKRSNNG